MSVSGAYTVKGFLVIDIIQGTYNTAEYNHWFLHALLPMLRPYPQPNSIVIIDNAPWHDMPYLRMLCLSVGAILLPMSAYSADLSPLEKMWQLSKMFLRRNGGYHPGNDDNNTVMMAALEFANKKMPHVANFKSCGWYLDANNELDRWAILDCDLS